MESLIYRSNAAAPLSSTVFLIPNEEWREKLFCKLAFARSDRKKVWSKVLEKGSKIRREPAEGEGHETEGSANGMERQE